MIDSFSCIPFDQSPAFDFNTGVAINESHSYKLKSAILKVEVVYETPNVLFNNDRVIDLLYNHCIDNTLAFDFYLSHGSDKGM